MKQTQLFKKMVLKGIYALVVPSRFLTLLAHFFILICLLWDRDENYRLCSLRYNSYDQEYVEFYNQEYVISLFLSLASLLIEFLGFLLGISMFSELHCLFSIICHASAALAWSISYIDQWDCSSPYSWYIFMTFSSPPLISELIIVIRFICRIRQY